MDEDLKGYLEAMEARLSGQIGEVRSVAGEARDEAREAKALAREARDEAREAKILAEEASDRAGQFKLLSEHHHHDLRGAMRDGFDLLNGKIDRITDDHEKRIRRLEERAGRS